MTLPDKGQPAVDAALPPPHPAVDGRAPHVQVVPGSAEPTGPHEGAHRAATGHQQPPAEQPSGEQRGRAGNQAVPGFEPPPELPRAFPAPGDVHNPGLHAAGVQHAAPTYAPLAPHQAVPAQGYPVPAVPPLLGHQGIPGNQSAPAYQAAPGYQTPLAQQAAPGYQPTPGYDGAGYAPPLPGAGWGGPPYAPGGGTNGLAIATLVLSLTFWPVAFITGPISLSQIRRRRQGGRGFAIAGLLLSLLWAVITVVIVVAVIAGLAGGGALSSLGGSSATGTQVAGTVQVGQCFDEAPVGAKVVDCSGPHDRELFFSGLVMGNGTVGYPSETLLHEEAGQMCLAAFAAYVQQSYEDSQFAYDTYVPDEAAWAAGDRTAACAISPYGGGVLMGSAAGTGL